MVTTEEIQSYIPYIVIGALFLLIFIAWLRGRKVKHIVPMIIDDGWKLVESFEDLATDGATPQEILITTQRLYDLVEHLCDLFNVPVETLPTIRDLLNIEERQSDKSKQLGVSTDDKQG